MDIIDLVRVLACVPFLIYACITDWETRRVPNKLWIPMIAIGVILDAYTYFILGNPFLIRVLLSVSFIFVLMYIFFYMGSFGGADAKALIAISVLLPVYPDLSIAGYTLPITGVPLTNIFAFSVLCNAAIIAIILVAPYLLIRNLRSLSLKEMREKPFFILLGYKTKISELKDKHVKLMEHYEEKDGELTRILTYRATNIDEEVMKTLEENLSPDDTVWVTPGIPAIVSITVGFFVALIYGDLLYLLVQWFVV